MRNLFLALCALPFLFTTTQAIAANPFGKWIDEKGKTQVQLFECNGKVCGKIIWLKKPLKNGKPKSDFKNKKKHLRNRPVLGLKVIYGMKQKGGAKWKGKAYNPDDGSIYKTTLKFVNANTAKLKGCWKIICKTRTWKRVK